MVLQLLSDLATGFEGCEKKLEIDFHLTRDTSDCRSIPRDQLDSMLDDAKCTIISVQKNKDFDAYVLSESSLFVYPSKMLLKTCGTTLLLKSVSKMLSAAKSVGAEPDFLQFSRSNFLFPHRQHFPHRAFTEETEYLNSSLGVEGEAYILGSLNGARWHLYIWDFNKLHSNEYRQQTLEIIMFNLDEKRMKTFYNKNNNNNESNESSSSPSSPSEAKESQSPSSSSPIGIGFPCTNGPEATSVSGIDKLIPGALIDSHLFSPCGYSCNAMIDTSSSSASSSSSSSSSSLNTPHGKQGSHEQAYFTIHITPEPQCSFVSFETNVVLPSYTSLVRQVISTFRPGSFCLSLFVDGKSQVGDSRSGIDWEFRHYVNKGATHHAFPAGYNATCAQYELTTANSSLSATSSGSAATHHNVIQTPLLSPSSPLTSSILYGLDGMTPSSYETISSLSFEQMKMISVEKLKRNFRIIEAPKFDLNSASASDFSENQQIIDIVKKVVEDAKQSEGKGSGSGESAVMRNIIDISQLVRRFHQWISTFSRVVPCYVVPPQGIPDGVALILSVLGCFFSCSQPNTVDSLIKLKIPSSRIVFDRAVKTQNHIHTVRDNHLDMMVVNSVEDILNIKKEVEVVPHSHNNKTKILLNIVVNVLEENYMDMMEEIDGEIFDDEEHTNGKDKDVEMESKENHFSRSHHRAPLAVSVCGVPLSSLSSILPQFSSSILTICGVKLEFVFPSSSTSSSSSSHPISISVFRRCLRLVSRVFHSVHESLGSPMKTLLIGLEMPAVTSPFDTEIMSIMESEIDPSVRILSDPTAFFDQEGTASVAFAILHKKIKQNVISSGGNENDNMENGSKGESNQQNSKRKSPSPSSSSLSSSHCLYYVDESVKSSLDENSYPQRPTFDTTSEEEEDVVMNGNHENQKEKEKEGEREQNGKEKSERNDVTKRRKCVVVPGHPSVSATPSSPSALSSSSSSPSSSTSTSLLSADSSFPLLRDTIGSIPSTLSVGDWLCLHTKMNSLQANLVGGAKGHQQQIHYVAS